MTTNISKEKREILINKIKEIKQFIASSPQDENTSTLLTYIADIEKDIKGKKYGLVFEEHKEAIDEKLENYTPVLSEDKDLFINNGGQINFLIEGDNLASLQLLEKTHKGAIDFIYIDPPYNTGGTDFIYDDKCIDANDTFRHSKWLSFLSKRLNVAYKLLRKNGVIFISIDDNELAELKILCDEIFGISNFIANVVRVAKTTSFRGNYFAPSKDYILCYAKTIKELENFVEETKNDSQFKKIETDGPRKGEFYRDDIAFYLSTLETRPNQRYFIECPDGELVVPPGTTMPTDMVDGSKVTPENGDGVWRWEQKQYLSKKHLIAFKRTTRSPLLNQNGEKASWNIYTKSYLLDKKEKGNIPRDLLEGFLNRNGSEELSKLDIDFSFPKPSKLIEYLIKITDKNKNITILDFFAGSGTTGHAVMKLNSEDGGNRKFILCTNNENNICRDVTYERIKRVIEKENYKASLKYMKVDFVPISDKLYYEYADELLKHIKELVELENGINFNGNKELAIILTEEDLDNFTNNITDECKIIYLGHNVLPTEEQEELFKKHEIKINIIPDYYYRDLEG